MISTMNNDEEVFSFIVEWFDPVPEVIKKYLLRFYNSSNAVEMKEVASGRKFLQRTKIDSSIVSKKDFFLGATILIFGRDLKVVEYGDDFTRKSLNQKSEKAVCILLPSVCRLIGTIISLAENEGNLTLADLQAFSIMQEYEDKCTTKELKEAADLLEINVSDLKNEISFESGNPSSNEARFPRPPMNYYVALEFRGENAITALIEALSAESSIPKIRDQVRKTIFPSPTCTTAMLYKKHFLSKRYVPMATYNKERSTCCVLKPHIIKERKVGPILDDIITSRKMDLTAMQLFHLDRIRALEFYEVYKGAVKEYNSMVDELTSGPVLAMEIAAGVEEFRSHVGPWDVDMAKSLRGDSIRAKFGNAVHCTDLPEDNISELSYFFDIMHNECKAQENMKV